MASRERFEPDGSPSMVDISDHYSIFQREERFIELCQPLQENREKADELLQ